MRNENLIRIVAALHLVTAGGMALFWVGFYSGVLFPPELMSQRIENYAGYVAWEKAFTLPDLLLAAAMVLGGLRLLRAPADALGRNILLACSGALLFLGVLDLNYGLANEMYSLGHLYSYALMDVWITLPLVSLFSLWALQHADGTRAA